MLNATFSFLVQDLLHDTKPYFDNLHRACYNYVCSYRRHAHGHVSGVCHWSPGYDQLFQLSAQSTGIAEENADGLCTG